MVWIFSAFLCTGPTNFPSVVCMDLFHAALWNHTSPSFEGGVGWPQAHPGRKDGRILAGEGGSSWFHVGLPTPSVAMVVIKTPYKAVPLILVVPFDPVAIPSTLCYSPWFVPSMARVLGGLAPSLSSNHLVAFC